MIRKIIRVFLFLLCVLLDLEGLTRSPAPLEVLRRAAGESNQRQIERDLKRKKGKKER